MFNFILPQLFIKIEKWKWNKEYRVYVSNYGNFRNEHKQLLPIKINNNGYCLIKTECGLKLAHRVVMLTWKPIPNAEELTVDHLNHNKRDNCLENLEWVTKEENELRAKEDFIDIEISNKDIKTYNFVLKAGQKTFYSYNEAADWLMETQGMKDAKKEVIIARIKNAIKHNKMYCGRKWKVV